MPLPGRRVRVVLAVLALDANRVVSIDRLVDAVWDESPPSTAREQIQICVSRLRTAFTRTGLPNIIVTRSPGYLLTVRDGELDADVFEDAVAHAKMLAEQGRLADAATQLRAALGLWRGCALEGLPGATVEARARLLEEQRLAATEERIRLDLALGHHDDLAGELLALVAEHPLRERLSEYLMLALHRSGRQSEALQVYRSARARLAEELGIEPGTELRRIEHAIMLGKDTLDIQPPIPQPTAEPAATAQPGQLPPDIADFTGRADAVAQLRDALSVDTEVGTVRVALVTGPGGVGKSATAVHVAHCLRGQFPDGQLYAELSGSGVRSAHPGEILARFLRALGVAPPSVPDGVAERAELYRSHLADRRVLVVLDDVRDEAQVAPLLPGGASCRVLLTSRSRLSGLPGLHTVELGVLAQPNAVRLLARIAGGARVTAEPEAARRIARLCDGLPLAVRIAGARLAARPHWRLERLADRLANAACRLDELEHGGLGVRANLQPTYSRLSGVERLVLRRLSLVDADEFTGWAGAALAGTDVVAAEDVLDRLADAQVVEPVPEPVGDGARFRLPELVRVFASERAAAEEPPERADLARRRYFETLLALARLAHRRTYGGDFTLLHSPVPVPALAPSLVDSLAADPVGWLDGQRATLMAAIRQTARLGWDELCWGLAMASVTLFEARCHFDDWRESAALALGCTRAAGNTRGEAAMRYSTGSLLLVERRAADAYQELTVAADAFERCGDAHGQALVLRNLAHLDRLAGDDARALSRYDQALAGVRDAGDLVGQAHVLSNLAALYLDADDPKTARDLLREALPLCRGAGSRRVEAQVLHRLGEVDLHEGDPVRAADAFSWVLRLVRHERDQIGEAYALLGLGRARAAEGHHSQAATCLSESLSLARALGERLVEGRALYSLGELDLSRRRTDLAVRRLTRAAEIFAEVSAARWRASALSLLATASPGPAGRAVGAGGTVRPLRSAGP